MYAVKFIQISAFVATLQLACGAVNAQTPVQYANQGDAWTEAARNQFYTQDQGSKMIPLAWLKALKRPGNDQPFLEGGLASYGYLPNPANPDGLPVGFNAVGAGADRIIGMTCSACHTRQINIAGQPLRIDGGPGIVDFQSLLSDIDTAVSAVLSSDATFKPFAAAVLDSANPDPSKVTALKVAVANWFLRYDTLMQRALPQDPLMKWGPSRLDAVAMIFDRVTGLDIGKESDAFIIADNIKRADAPVRYPFLWNAAIQDKTQWPGFADNGSNILGLARNTGEVFGVFGTYQPRKFGPIVDFLHNNSVNFEGLHRLEELIKQIGWPRWPQSATPIKADLKSDGEKIFNRKSADGGCADCHGQKPGKVQFPAQQTWATCVMNVGTDKRAYDILGIQVNTGVLNGVGIPRVVQLGPTAAAIKVLTVSVIGSIVDNFLMGGSFEQRIQSDMKALIDDFLPSALPASLPDELQDLSHAFHELDTSPKIIASVAAAPDCDNPNPPKGAYEGRVLQGIWAAAPYLHNGSVPTLADLLKPAAQRPASFKIGPNYDLTNVGLAKEQSAFDFTLQTTGCDDVDSGRSRCGHEYGTKLSDADRTALLEYLKSL